METMSGEMEMEEDVTLIGFANCGGEKKRSFDMKREFHCHKNHINFNLKVFLGYSHHHHHHHPVSFSSSSSPLFNY